MKDLGFQKIFSRLKSTFFCSIKEAKLFAWTYSGEALFRLMLNSKGGIRFYVNDVKVPKRNSYVCGQYKDTGSIKIRVRGIFNSKTLFLPTYSSTQFVSFDLNLPLITKMERLQNKEISYISQNRNAVIDSKNMESKRSSISKQYSLEVLKLQKKFSLNKKDFKINNPTNQLKLWKN